MPETDAQDVAEVDDLSAVYSCLAYFSATCLFFSLTGDPAHGLHEVVRYEKSWGFTFSAVSVAGDPKQAFKIKSAILPVRPALVNKIRLSLSIHLS